MGASDMFDKAKGLIGDNADKIDGGADKAAEAIKGKTPDNVDPMVDKAAEAIKGQTPGGTP